MEALLISNASNGSAIRFNNGMADKVTSMLWTNISKSRPQNYGRHYRVYSTNTTDIRNMSFEIGPIHLKDN